MLMTRKDDEMIINFSVVLNVLILLTYIYCAKRHIYDKNDIFNVTF